MNSANDFSERQSDDGAFDLAAYLSSRAGEVDRVLDAWMPAADTPPPVLHRAMRYAVLNGGKRLRPILCLAAAELVGGSRDAAFAPAAAVEVLHAYTLVHDDLPSMDDDDERRGQPTVHVAFGEANAILVGDALQALAFELLARTPPAPRWPAQDLVAELAGAAGSRGIVGGQVDDLTDVGVADADRIRSVHERKTAALFRTALHLGAMAANATRQQRAALGAYGSALGLAFQVTDDLLDDTAAPDSRPAAAETTCMAIYSREEAQALAASCIEDALAALRQAFPRPQGPLVPLARHVLQRVH